jgi:hypothetical protein
MQEGDTWDMVSRYSTRSANVGEALETAGEGQSSNDGAKLGQASEETETTPRSRKTARKLAKMRLVQ